MSTDVSGDRQFERVDRLQQMNGFGARRGSEAGEPEVALEERPSARHVDEHHGLDVRIAADRIELQRLLAVAQYFLPFEDLERTRFPGLPRILERVRWVGVRRLDDHPNRRFV